MRKSIRRYSIAFIAALVLITNAPAMAGAKTPANQKIVIDKMEYERNGKVEIDFRKNVVFKNAKVKITDEDGKKYDGVLKTDKDDRDECKVYIKNFDLGHTYTIEISGIKNYGSKEYTSIRKSFKTAEKADIKAEGISVKVKEIDYDQYDEELDIKFYRPVDYKNETIVITDLSSKKQKAEIIDVDQDDMEISVRGLKEGNTYQFKITGIKGRNDSSYGSITGTFQAVEEDD